MTRKVNPEEEGAPLSVWIVAIAIVILVALGTLIMMGSVDNLINFIN